MAGAGGANLINLPILRLLIFGLDETREISQRILPAKIARFHRNGVGKTFLHDRPPRWWQVPTARSSSQIEANVVGGRRQ